MKLIRVFALVFAMALITGVAVPAPVPQGAKETPKSELAKLTGEWQVVTWMLAGNTLYGGEYQPRKTLAFAEDGTFVWDEINSNGKVARIDPAPKLKEIDFLFTDGFLKDQTQKAIYKFEEDTFTECFSRPGEARPTEFSSTKENGWGLIVYKRMKPNK